MIDPFENDSQSMQIGELIIENQQDKITIYGDIDIHLSSEGLSYAKQLHELTGRIVAAMTSQLKPTATPQSDLEPSSHLTNNSENDKSETKARQLIDNPFL